MLASVTCGYFATLKEAAEAISDGCDLTYIPNPENTEKYQKLYNEYKILSKYFAEENLVMKRIKGI